MPIQPLITLYLHSNLLYIVGLCLHQCKLPAQQFFANTLGVPLMVSPNFQTQVCALQIYTDICYSYVYGWVWVYEEYQHYICLHLYAYMPIVIIAVVQHLRLYTVLALISNTYTYTNILLQECQWSWGETPLPPDEDPSFPTGCLAGCPTRGLLFAGVESGPGGKTGVDGKTGSGQSTRGDVYVRKDLCNV